MKTYGWLALVVALLITLCEVLVFNSEVTHAPQQQANVAAATDVGRDTHLPGG